MPTIASDHHWRVQMCCLSGSHAPGRKYRRSLAWPAQPTAPVGGKTGLEMPDLDWQSNDWDSDSNSFAVGGERGGGEGDAFGG